MSMQYCTMVQYSMCLSLVVDFSNYYWRTQMQYNQMSDISRRGRVRTLRAMRL